MCTCGDVLHGSCVDVTSCLCAELRSLDCASPHLARKRQRHGKKRFGGDLRGNRISSLQCSTTGLDPQQNRLRGWQASAKRGRALGWINSNSMTADCRGIWTGWDDEVEYRCGDDINGDGWGDTLSMSDHWYSLPARHSLRLRRTHCRFECASLFSTLDRGSDKARVRLFS